MSDENKIIDPFTNVEYVDPEEIVVPKVAELTDGTVGGQSVSTTEVSAGAGSARIGTISEGGNECFYVGDPVAALILLGQLKSRTSLNEYGIWIGTTGQYLKYTQAGGLVLIGAGIVAGSIDIPDKNTTANSLHVDTLGNLWIGCTYDDFVADHDNAAIYFLNDGTGKIRKSLRLGAGVDYIDLDGENVRIKTSNYIAGAFGSGTYLDKNLLETGNGRFRGELRTVNFQKDIISSVAGGQITTPDSATLAVDVATGDTQITIAGESTLAVGDSVRMKEGVQDEWMIVNSIASAPTYGVRRDILTTTTLYSSEKIGNTANPSIAQIAFTAVDCTGLTKANGLLKIDLKCDVPANMTSTSYVEITSSGTPDSQEWTWAPLSSLGITTSYQTFYLPLSSFSTQGGELNVSAINFIRCYSSSSSGNITLSWRNAEIIQTSTSNYPVWTKGATVVNFGQNGQGGIFNTASEPNSPYTQYFTHDGDPWDHLNTRVRIGNLKGIAGISDDAYGFFAGDYLGGKYMSYDDLTGEIQGVNIPMKHTFVAGEDLILGQTVGASFGVDGRIARALRMSPSDAVNVPAEFSTHEIDILSVISVDTNKYVMMYYYSPVNELLRAVAFELDLDTLRLTFGASFALNDNAEGIANGVCKYDTNKFIVVATSDGSNRPYYATHLVSGLTISYLNGGYLNTGSTNLSAAQCCQLDTNKIAFCYYTMDGTGTFHGFATIGVNGTATVIDSEISEIVYITSHAEHLAMTKIATDKFVIFNGDSGYGVVCTTESSTYTVGTALSLITNPAGDWKTTSVISMATDTFWARGKNGLAYCTVSTRTITRVDLETYTNDGVSNLFKDGSILYEISTNTTNATLNGIYKLIVSSSNIVRTQLLNFTIGATHGVKFTDDGTTYIGIGSVAAKLPPTYHIKGMSNAFFGIVQETVAAGGTVKVLNGGLDDNQSGLIPGGAYQANGLGGLQFVASSSASYNPYNKFVTAVSSTEVVF